MKGKENSNVYLKGLKMFVLLIIIHLLLNVIFFIKLNRLHSLDHKFNFYIFSIRNFPFFFCLLFDFPI